MTRFALTFAVLLIASLARGESPNSCPLPAHGQQTYSDAYAAAVHCGQPLIVIVGGVYCPHCHALTGSLDASGLPYVYVLPGDPMYPIYVNSYAGVPQIVARLKIGADWRVERAIGNIGAGGIRAMLARMGEEPILPAVLPPVVQAPVAAKPAVAPAQAAPEDHPFRPFRWRRR